MHGVFCRGRDIMLSVKSMKVGGDASEIRACDFSFDMSHLEFVSMKTASTSADSFFLLVLVAVGDQLACRVVSILRQPYNLIPAQLLVEPILYRAELTHASMSRTARMRQGLANDSDEDAFASSLNNSEGSSVSEQQFPDQNCPSEDGASSSSSSSSSSPDIGRIVFKGR